MKEMKERVRKSLEQIRTARRDECRFNPPATEHEIEQLLAIYPNAPADLIESLRVHNGCERGALYDALRFFSVCLVLNLHADLSGLDEDELMFDKIGSTPAGWIRDGASWRPEWIAVLHNDVGWVGIDLAPAADGIVGQVFYHSDISITVIAKSFVEYLEKLASELDAATMPEGFLCLPSMSEPIQTG